ncbi:hypothetical protein ACFP1Z_03050 [Streptomyces gamaensis]|uniref:DUF4148 domain-containing protein n=1 Tax=Streptomyces gamaensis TaxID=1763542 RepID=A0ABW0YTL0_9ACTN
MAVAVIGAAVTAVTISAAFAREGGESAPPAPARPDESAVSRTSDQDPRSVQEFWTPEQIRQANENMRHATGTDD